MFKKFVSSVVAIALVIMSSGILNPFVATAASITTASAAFGRLKAAVPSDSVVLMFASPSGIQTGGADTISLTFSADFSVAAAVAANYDVGLATTSASCSTATFTEGIVALTPSATDWGVGVAGNVVTLSPETDITLTAGYCIRIRMGLAAITGTTGAANTITNGNSDDDDTIAIAGAFGDTGSITVDIVDDDQVSVTATVNQTMSFDLDTGFTAGETVAPYTVPLGVLSAATVTRSNTSSINQIFADGGTNASGGMNVTIKNSNGANGLASSTTPADKIPSATATMAAGTPNYGLCVDSATVSGFARATAYNTTCTVNGATNAVVGLTSTVADILTSSAPVAAGHAQIQVNAAISTATPAHTDYTDTLTFIATASY